MVILSSKGPDFLWPLLMDFIIYLFLLSYSCKERRKASRISWYEVCSLSSLYSRATAVRRAVSNLSNLFSINTRLSLSSSNDFVCCNIFAPFVLKGTGIKIRKLLKWMGRSRFSRRTPSAQQYVTCRNGLKTFHNQKQSILS